MTPDVDLPSETTAAEYFAEFVAAQPRQRRYRMRASVRLLGQALGREATLADMAAGDAGQKLEAFMARRLYSRSTTAGYVEALRQLRRAAEIMNDIAGTVGG